VVAARVLEVYSTVVAATPAVVTAEEEPRTDWLPKSLRDLLR
jgi:hypothetical protein